MGVRPFDFIVRRNFREEVTLKLTFPWRRGHLPRIAAKDRETVFVSGGGVSLPYVYVIHSQAKAGCTAHTHTP